MSLDLGSSTGFAQATVSGASSALNLLTGLNNSNWNVQECAYGHPPEDLVLFNIFKSQSPYNGAVDQVTDNIARRVPAFKFPYVDGQTTDDLGREGESYDFNILLYGPNYYQAYLNLINEFNNPLPGTLVHPVRGRMVVKFQKAQVLHRSTERQAVALRATFIEHNFEVSFQAPTSTTKSSLSAAVAFIGSLAAVLTAIQSDQFALKSLTQAIKSAVSAFNTSYTNTLVAINTSFNGGTSADLPGLLPNTPGTGTAFTLAESPNDPYSALTPTQIQAIQSPVLSPSQANDLVAALWALGNDAIALMESANGGQGSLQMYAQVMTIRQSCVAVAQALAIALQNSNQAIINYVTPRLMTIREVCFANNYPVNSFDDVLTLNPQILSANYIPEMTTLQVPTSS